MNHPPKDRLKFWICFGFAFASCGFPMAFGGFYFRGSWDIPITVILFLFCAGLGWHVAKAYKDGVVGKIPDLLL